eukprot:COSAG01_NODE_1206_length_11242_cov_29.405905_4_plen_75_part_00
MLLLQASSAGTEVHVQTQQLETGGQRPPLRADTHILIPNKSKEPMEEEGAVGALTPALIAALIERLRAGLAVGA